MTGTAQATRDLGVARMDRLGAVARITLNRPEVLNALNPALVTALARLLAEAAEDPAVRVILLVGAGRAFAAGADIGDFTGASPADALGLARRAGRLNDAVAACPKPVLAAVQGHCLGAGFELALACDLRLAAEDARFGLPEIRLGILPGGGGTVRLTRLAGGAVARQMVLTGAPIPAARALELGLVAAVHPCALLAEAAMAQAQALANLAPFALSQAKTALAIATDADTATALEAEMQAFALCFSTGDQKEGARAFLEKRAPRFTGS